MFQPSLRDDVFGLSELPALRGRAKFKPPLRGEHFLWACDFLQQAQLTSSQLTQLRCTRTFTRS